MTDEIEKFNKILPPNAERQWKDVTGYEGFYMISDDGYVGSMERTCRAGTGTRRVPARLIKPQKMFSGKRFTGFSVGLHDGDSPQLTMGIGRLVLIAFEGEVAGHVANFIDGDRTNHKLSNMEWRLLSDLQHEVQLGKQMGGLADRINSSIGGRSNKELAAAGGVSEWSVREWRVGRIKSIGPHRLDAVAQFLGVDPSWLATGDLQDTQRG